MKGIWLILGLAFLAGPGLNTIAKINQLKEEASQAYKNQDFKDAIAKYEILRDSFNVNEDPAIMNLANAYFMTNDTARARRTYNNLVTSQNSTIKSQAYLQLGLLAHRQQQEDRALDAFKSSLLADHQNKAARFNYELIKKLQAQKQQQDQQEQPEPSDYAKRLKEQASALADRQKYREALELMQQGLQQDNTVRAYMDFIQRLNNVVEINDN